METRFQGGNPFSTIKLRSKADSDTSMTSMKNIPVMEDIATLQKMIKYIHVQVAPQLVLQEVQGLADMATVCFTRLAWT